jgi:hypothetical protein
MDSQEPETSPPQMQRYLIVLTPQDIQPVFGGPLRELSLGPQIDELASKSGTFPEPPLPGRQRDVGKTGSVDNKLRVRVERHHF